MGEWKGGLLLASAFSRSSASDRRSSISVLRASADARLYEQAIEKCLSERGAFFFKKGSAPERIDEIETE